MALKLLVSVVWVLEAAQALKLQALAVLVGALAAFNPLVVVLAQVVVVTPAASEVWGRLALVARASAALVMEAGEVRLLAV